MKVRLSHLVFLTLALTGVAGALAMAAALSFNLSRGFSAYLSDRDAEQLDRLVADVAAFRPAAAPRGAGQNASRELQLVLDHVGGPRSPTPNMRRDGRRGGRAGGRPEGPRRANPPGPPMGPGGPGRPGSPRPGENFRAPPEDFPSRLILTNLAGDRVLGPPPPPAADRHASLISRPLVVEGQAVGTLTLLPRAPVPDGVDAMFLDKQFKTGGMIVLLLLVGSLIPAWLIARGGTKVAEGLTAATSDIADGQYKTRVSPSTISEIDDVANNVNALADHLGTLEAARRQWLAEISHELRTPLAAMTGQIEALVDGIRPLDQDAVHSLHEDAQSLGRIVDDLHFLAVSDLSGPSCTFEDLDAVQLCEQVVAQYSAHAAAAQLTLAFEHSTAGPLPVAWDKRRILQVLINILTNSIRYTDAPGQIRLTLAEKGDEVTIIVDDTSPGVAPADRERLVEPLFRVDATRNRASGGSGLGLSVSANIIAAHGGTLHPDASPMGGLRITLTLPTDPAKGDA